MAILTLGTTAWVSAYRLRERNIHIAVDEEGTIHTTEI